jgi:hypothetical protein
MNSLAVPVRPIVETALIEDLGLRFQSVVGRLAASGLGFAEHNDDNVSAKLTGAACGRYSNMSAVSHCIGVKK